MRITTFAIFASIKKQFDHCPPGNFVSSNYPTKLLSVPLMLTEKLRGSDLF